MTPAFSDQRQFAGRLGLAVLVGLALRLAAILSVSTVDDPDNYLPLARSLAEGRGFSIAGKPTAYRPPLYPLILTPLVSAFGERPWPAIAALHLVLGAGTVALTGMAAYRLGLGRNRALLAAGIVAIDPTLVWQTRSVMTETLAAFLLAAALATLARQAMPVGFPGTFGGGLLLGLGALCRPSLLPGALLAGLAAGIARPAAEGQRRIWRAGGIGLGVLVVLTPWAWRNVQAVGEPVWTTTHGGYTLALANNPAYYRDVLHGSSGRVWTGHDQWLWWDSVNTQTKGFSEPQADRYLRNKAIRLAIDQPHDFLLASWNRLLRFWSVAPAAAVYPAAVRWGTAIVTLPVLLAFLVGLGQPATWRWPAVVAPCLIVGLSTVHLLYWTDMRMRSPIVPAIAIVAAQASLPLVIPRIPGRGLSQTGEKNARSAD
jgi:4-amino-4-deoxy-L-arabinose transferase-like glycosyltransferase